MKAKQERFGVKDPTLQLLGMTQNCLKRLKISLSSLKLQKVVNRKSRPRVLSTFHLIVQLETVSISTCSSASHNLKGKLSPRLNRLLISILPHTCMLNLKANRKLLYLLRQIQCRLRKECGHHQIHVYLDHMQLLKCYNRPGVHSWSLVVFHPSSPIPQTRAVRKSCGLPPQWKVTILSLINYT